MNDQRRAPRGALARVVLLGAGLLWAAAARSQELPETPEVPTFGSVLERGELLEAVLDRNPGIAAARDTWEAARERIAQAESLVDPTASYSLAPLSLGSSDTRLGEQFRLGQRIPFPGTLRLRAEVASSGADAAGQQLDELRLRLATAASLLFDDYYSVVRALEINAEHQRLLEDVQAVAVSRYSAGLAPQQAPIRAEVEGAHLLHRKVALETRRRTLIARLNTLLHRDPRASLPPPPAELAVPDAWEGTGEAPAAEPALRPEVLGQHAEIAARRSALALARLALYPDFEASTAYNSMWATEEHRWTVGVGVNLPIRRRRAHAGIAEAEARLAAAESELARLEDQVRVEIEVAALELAEALHVVRLYRDRVLPAARDGIAAARSGFETGAATMLSLIDAERSLRTAELSYHQALADASSRRAELDRALGRLPFALPAAPVETMETEP